MSLLRSRREDSPSGRAESAGEDPDASTALMGGGRSGGDAHRFSFWVAVSFTVNYIIGCGFLGIPNAFKEAGWALGMIGVIGFTYLCDVTKDLVVEAMARTEGIMRLQARIDQHRAHQASPDLVPPAELVVRKSDFYVYDRKFEVPELMELLLGVRAKSLYTLGIMLYQVGSLWAYGSVFASSFSGNVPLPIFNDGNTCDIEKDADCNAPFHFWLGIFALVAVPLACMELTEQVGVQVTMAIARIVVMGLLVGTVGAAFGCDKGGGVAFTEVEPGSERSISAFDINGLGIMLPIALFANIFHHSIPILAQPVRDRSKLSWVFATAFIITGLCYSSIGVTLAFFFGSTTESQVNLNWRGYVGCVPAHADGSPVSESDKNAWAHFVSFVILIFPAMDVLSAFPLNAITLGNNLMSSLLPKPELAEAVAACNATTEEEGAPSCRRLSRSLRQSLCGVTTDDYTIVGGGGGPGAADTPGADLAATNSSASGTNAGGGVSLNGTPVVAPERERRFPTLLGLRRGFVVKVGFRLLAAVPPLVGAMFVHDLGNILQVTGLTGIGIALVMPAVAQSASRTLSRALAREVVRLAREASAVNALATDSLHDADRADATGSAPRAAARPVRADDEDNITALVERTMQSSYAALARPELESVGVRAGTAAGAATAAAAAVGLHDAGEPAVGVVQTLEAPPVVKQSRLAEDFRRACCSWMGRTPEDAELDKLLATPFDSWVGHPAFISFLLVLSTAIAIYISIDIAQNW